MPDQPGGLVYSPALFFVTSFLGRRGCIVQEVLIILSRWRLRGIALYVVLSVHDGVEEHFEQRGVRLIFQVQ